MELEKEGEKEGWKNYQQLLTNLGIASQDLTTTFKVI